MRESWRAGNERIARHPERAGTSESRDERLGRIAREFDEAAQKEGADPSELLAQLRNDLPENEADLLVQKVAELGWNITEEQAAVNGEPFQLLPDGAAELTLNKRKVRIAENGFLQVKGKWFAFAGGRFNEISEAEVERRREANKKMPTSPVRREPRENRQAPAERTERPQRKPEAEEEFHQQIGMEENAAPPALSMDDYGFVEYRTVDQAHETFSSLYTSRDKLAQAYHEAVSGLTVSKRRQFDDDLEHVFSGMHREAGKSDLPMAILYSVINNELRMNPPVPDPENSQKKIQTQRRNKKKRSAEKK